MDLFVRRRQLEPRRISASSHARAVRRARHRWLLLSLLSLLASPVSAQQLPQVASDKHLGVSSCAGAPCHGNRAAVGKVVRQNEYSTWIAQDRHARAYEVLLNESSQRIARNLALEHPASESPLCLDCHADHVPAERRGEAFTSFEDGVTCEACHGGAERWIQAHTARASNYAENLELGMYPTDDPAKRAALCLSCHFGTGDKFVDHRLMGAGHPRMSFELDTFGAFQPAHFDPDADYRERGKQAPPAAKTWAIGQAVQVAALLEALQDGRAQQGVWPEFVLFDCHACHHAMSDQRWSPRGTMGRAGQPGVVRFNDSSLLMLHSALVGVDVSVAKDLRREAMRLHATLSLGEGNRQQILRSLEQLVARGLEALEAWQPAPASLRRIARSLIRDGLEGQYRDYAAAEQAAMALQALAQTLQSLGALTPEALRGIDLQLQEILEVTDDDERYQPSGLLPSLRRIEARLVEKVEAE